MESIGRGGGGDDGWLFARNLSGTRLINECTLTLAILHTHTNTADSHSHRGLSADLFPLTLSSAEIWTSDKKYKQDVSLNGTGTVLLSSPVLSLSFFHLLPFGHNASFTSKSVCLCLFFLSSFHFLIY